MVRFDMRPAIVIYHGDGWRGRGGLRGIVLRARGKRERRGHTKIDFLCHRCGGASTKLIRET